MDKIRLGTIGSSKIAQYFISGTRLTKNVELAAIYSRSLGRGKEFSAENGNVPVFTDLEAFASYDGIDAVYIASPNKFHFEQAKLMLTHKKHVICEKSISAHPEEVEELVRLAEENGVIFLEALMFMHFPHKAKLEQALSEIGNIHSVSLSFCQRSSRLDAFKKGEIPNIFDPECEAGALLDLGVYCIYPAVYFFGKPEKVLSSSVLLSTGVDGSGSIIMQYPDKLVTINYSKLCQGDAPSQFIGDEGCVTVSSISQLDNITLHKRGAAPEVLFSTKDKPHLMSYEASAFADLIINGKTDYYRTCTETMLTVSRIMYDVRMQCGIKFKSDK